MTMQTNVGAGAVLGCPPFLAYEWLRGYYSNSMHNEYTTAVSTPTRMGTCLVLSPGWCIVVITVVVHGNSRSGGNMFSRDNPVAANFEANSVAIIGAVMSVFEPLVPLMCVKSTHAHYDIVDP